MELEDLNRLRYDSNMGLYDLWTRTYYHNIPNAINYIIVSEFQEMKMHLISKHIYNSDKYVSFLCNFNNISNPLNVMKGDKIYYIDSDSFDNFIFKDNKDLVNDESKDINYKKNVDGKRKEYVDNNYKINASPTLKKNPSNSVVVEGNKIIVGKK